MVEGGQVDYVEHGNDVASVLHEMLELDQAIGVAMEFAEANPDTLLVVTADHDTGGLAIAYSSHQPPGPLNCPTGRPGRQSIISEKEEFLKRWPNRKNPSMKMAIDSKGNPAAFKKEVEENSAFTITDEQAAALLARDSEGAFPADEGLRGVLCLREQSCPFDGAPLRKGNEHRLGRGNPYAYAGDDFWNGSGGGKIPGFDR